MVAGVGFEPTTFRL